MPWVSSVIRRAGLVGLIAPTASVGVALLLWVLAYQVPFEMALPIGGDTATHRRDYDAPFLHGFHESEPAHPAQPEWWTLSPGDAYRWTSSRAMVALPGVGGGQWACHPAGNERSPRPRLDRWDVACGH
ncbi:MAG: hypothetical protein HC884_01110, partial [Chloroflexaceae bacterium]|nr:hypothetical protein [Chloroflexaceae bacterium]